MNNPLINYTQTPDYSACTPELAEAALQTALTDFAQMAQRAETAPINWEDFWVPISAGFENLYRVWRQIRHIHLVMDSPAWRSLHAKYTGQISTQVNNFFQQEALYDNVRALAQKPLTPIQRHIIGSVLRDFEDSGVGLSSGQKEKFVANASRLSALKAKYTSNLMDATDDPAQDLLVSDEALLGEMPADIKTAAQTSQGKWKFTLKLPSFSAFMRYSPDRSLREEFYRKYYVRASSFTPQTDNTPLIEEILSLRTAQAGLLNCANFAELELRGKMAGQPAVVEKFLLDLLEKARPKAKREMDELATFAREKLDITDLRPWDLTYVADKYCQALYNFNSADMRPYLVAENIIGGMLACAEKLFGVTLTPGDSARWNKDVSYYDLKDSSGKIIAGLYFDLFARDGKKGGGWMSNCVPRCYQNGTLQRPIANIVCNFTPAAPEAPALLNWEDVRVLFHEFGHALHHLLTEIDDPWASGIGNVEWDAVELPSQFMENFMWDWRVIGPVALHVDTHAPMPEELFQQAVKTRQFNSGLFLLRQLRFALYDFYLHTRPSPDFLSILKEVYAQTSFLELPEWDRFPCGFSHIFSGGYAAGYYSYLWAECLSADAFARVEESGEVLNRELGGEFRQEILAKGGSRPAQESFVAFRGRELDSTALLRHHGLI